MQTPQSYGLFKPAYSITEAMALLSLGRTRIYELMKSGDLRATKCVVERCCWHPTSPPFWPSFSRRNAGNDRVPTDRHSWH